MGLSQGKMHTLYAAPLSLYSGKARSYLIKNRLPYRELTPTTDHYRDKVRKAAHMQMLPTLEAEDGEVIRDSTAILDYFEEPLGFPASPSTPAQRVLSRLFDVVGMEGLLRPAMHYRWSFPEDNDAFLQLQFESLVPGDRDRSATASRLMDRMRQAAGAFGVTPERAAWIEARYRAVLDALDAHWAQVPYLLGTRPSIGDYGLIAPFYGHLGRDPKPLALMQSEAAHAFRWVERMNRPELDLGEFVGDGADPGPGEFLANDEIPESLIRVLREIAVDFVPETMAVRDLINEWLAAESGLAAGTPLQRGVGVAQFSAEGTPLSGLAQPFRFYLLSRVQRECDALEASDRRHVEEILAQAGMTPILEARLDREIGRSDNLEVWL